MNTNQTQGGLQNVLHTAQGLLGSGQQNPQQTQGGLQNVLHTAQGLLGSGQQNPQQTQGGLQNVLHTAQGLIGNQQNPQQTQGGLQNVLHTAQGLIGNQQTTQPNGLANINNTIDTAQAMAGHTGNGGPGIHGLIDKAQGLTGHQGPVGGIQGALNTAQGAMNLQQLAGTGGQGNNLLSTAQGLIGGHNGQTTQGEGLQGYINRAQQIFNHGQNTQGQPVNQLGNINNTIDQVQSALGHNGQGGTGINGTIDKVQGMMGHTAQTGGNVNQGQGQGLINTAQNLLGGHGQTTQGQGQGQGLINTAQNLIGGHNQNAPTGQPVNRVGNINSTIDRAQGMLGHTGQGGTGVNGAIDRVQGFLGHTDQSGMH